MLLTWSLLLRSLLPWSLLDRTILLLATFLATLAGRARIKRTAPASED
jgi:hypothetical protein